MILLSIPVQYEGYKAAAIQSMPAMRRSLELNEACDPLSEARQYSHSVNTIIQSAMIEEGACRHHIRHVFRPFIAIVR